MNKERLLQLAAIVEKGHHKFNGVHAALCMSEWFHDYSFHDESEAHVTTEVLPRREDLQTVDAFKCNSTACIAGFACLLFDYKRASSLAHYNHESRAEEFLDLTSAQANRLFVGDTSSTITGPQAAKVIRHLAETGEVAWHIIE